MAKKSSKKQESVMECPPCKPCAPVWPAVALSIAGTAILIVSVVSWSNLNLDWVRRDRDQTEEREEDEQVGERGWVGADVQSQILPNGNVYTLVTPNGLRMDLPRNSAGRQAYEVSSRFNVSEMENRRDWEVRNYLVHIRYRGDASLNDPQCCTDRPSLSFELDYSTNFDWAPEHATYDTVTVRRLGQTRGGQSILTIAELYDGLGWWQAFSYIMVSNLTLAELQAANFEVRRVDLWRSQFIESEGSDTVWSLRSNHIRTTTSDADVAETVRILSTIRSVLR
ncbi:hypothetical protein FWC63_02855 [Candidatus Saccharibacteria bacterium]|nr:hypothetical protein [Candidatus Saccharibacteria bacterium]